MSPIGSLRTRDGTPQLAELDRLLGDFMVEEEIARTPQAMLYRIRSGNHDRPLALKVSLQPVVGEDLVRFQHEVRLLSEAGHPNVVEVFDFGVMPGSFPFLTMELLSGLDPMQTVQEGDWDLFYTFALQASAGLAHIHRHGIVHLDIKPANLGLVQGPDGRLTLKIMDFGLAQNVLGPLDRKIRGTLSYVAPEVLLQDRYDHRADLYSLGMTLFQLATGVLPSAGDDEAAIRFHLQGQRPDPQAYRSDMPGELAAILRTLLLKEPADRFPSAGKLMLELAAAAGREIDSASMALGAGRVLTSRMVGRSEPFASLTEALGAARRGEPTVVVVEGPEGVGKSRLLREFRLAAAMDGARVAQGRAVATRPEPLRPVLEALRRLGIEPKEGLRGTVPAEQERFRLFREVGEALQGAAAETPVLLLLLEDLQHSGEATRELLVWLASELSDLRLLVIGARRVGSRSEATREPVSLVRTVALGPLSPEDSRELVDASLATRGLPAALYEWVQERSGGVPGRIQQLLHHLVEERVLRFRQGEWKPSLPSLSRLASRPEAVEILDRERVSALTAEESSVLAAAAVIGEPVAWRELATLLAVPSEDTYRVIPGLVEKGFLEPVAEEEGVYGFSLPAVARSIYEDLGVERRQELHSAWAGRLEARLTAGEDDLVPVVAEHYWQAGARHEALPFLEQAAERARASFGFRDAAELLGRVAEVSQELGDDERTADARLRQAEALDAAGSSTRALNHYRSMIEQSAEPLRRAEDRRRQASLWLGASRLHGKLGEAEEQLQAADAGLDLLRDAPNSRELEVELLEGKAEALLALDEVDEAFAAARAALRMATGKGLSWQRVALLDVLGRVLGRQGQARKARFVLRRGLAASAVVSDERLLMKVRHDLAELDRSLGWWQEARAGHEANLENALRLHDPWMELAALQGLGTLDCQAGLWKSARSALERSLELRRRLGAREGQSEALLRMGEVEEMLGDWAAAERHTRRLLKLMTSEHHRDRVAAQGQLASLSRKRGKWSEAEETARLALAGAESLGDLGLLATCHQQLGLVEKDRGHWAPAAAHLQRGLELASAAGRPGIEASLHNSLADLTLRRGEVEAARGHVDQALERAEARGHRFEIAKTHVAQARLAVLDADPGAADKQFGEAVRAFEELEVPFEYARSLYEWGVRTRDPDLAVDRLDRALVAFERLGAATDYERTRGVIDGIRERNFLLAPLGKPGPGLWEVAKVVNSTLDLQEVLDRTMDLVLERLRAERGMVVLARPLTGELEAAVSRNLSSDGSEGARLSETVVRKVIEGREPVLSVDALTDPRFTGAESIVASHIVSILCVPLSIRDRLAGAIYVDHLSSQHLFEPRDLEFLVAFADQAAVAIENARLYGELQDHRHRLKAENESLRQEILSNRHLGNLIGKSRAIEQLKDTLERVAVSGSTVLVRGESGTGKGLVARILHSISPRREGPFVNFNCAALPETLVESELFGHEKGAFTGAVGQKPGRFELAHGGTIFLDEIGKVSRSVQAKLLRVVEDRQFERVGGTRTLQTDVRIVAATNLNLEEAISNGEFREDLYYRLNIIPIILPPLRERREDIPYLVEHFLEKISRDLGHPPRELEPPALDLFLRYRWPGNIRELEAAIHRALVLSRSDTLGIEDFAWIGGGELLPQTALPAALGLGARGLEEGNYQSLSERYDSELVAEALSRCEGKIRETARFLGIARNTLKAKIKKYELQTES